MPRRRSRSCVGGHRVTSAGRPRRRSAAIILNVTSNRKRKNRPSKAEAVFGKTIVSRGSRGPIGCRASDENCERFKLTARQTWQRPTLPRLKTKYHWRWSVSRPSSEWDRVQPLRHNHQVSREVRMKILTSCPLRLPQREPAELAYSGLSCMFLRPSGGTQTLWIILDPRQLFSCRREHRPPIGPALFHSARCHRIR